MQKDKNSTTTYEANKLKYSQIALPKKGALRINFDVEASSSTLTVYASVKVNNPGPAFYDAKFELSSVC